jgi:glycosyltransferase involved in cell wall biosynthesis
MSELSLAGYILDNLSLEKNIDQQKILHIITGLGDGGAEGVLYRLCKNSKNFKHEVISLTGNGKYTPMLEEMGVVVHPFHFSGITSFIRLISIIKSAQPYLVQTWMYHADLIGGIAAKLAGIKNVFWGIRHSNLEKGKVKLSTIYIAKLLALFSRFIPSKIICCANKAKEAHLKIGYCKDKLLVIQNGYDLSDFYISDVYRQKIRQEWKLADNTFVIGNVARYDPFKDHENLLRALQKLEISGVSFKCFLIGNGVTEQNQVLKSKVNELGLSGHVTLIGPRSDIPAVMNALDLHVLSSSSEGFPNVIAESMACGTFNVSTQVGDVSEIIPNPKFICATTDSEALFSVINLAHNMWLNSPDEFEKQKKQNEQVIKEKFSINTMVSTFEKSWRIL